MYISSLLADKESHRSKTQEEDANPTRRQLYSLRIVLRRHRLVGADEDVAVDEPGQSAANQRPHPVDPVAGEVSAGHRGAERPCRVHGAAAEGPGRQDVGPDDESDRDGRHRPQRPLLRVGRRGVHRVHEREGDDHLHHHAFQLAHAGRHAVRGDSLRTEGDLSEWRPR
ncbi:hypothetical protein B296_00000412 [Ensete ventricosum]|uniref:Uncharacterized protein n=1 Tax=Ensete ventricosum TaxID=4639 RepID=A0A427B055_ENSVE|nr:hypothetical protein B296_00000412 [Ensete ventricosum]